MAASKSTFASYIQRPLKYGNLFGCVYPTWRGWQVVRPTGRAKNLVRITILTQFVYILSQISAILTIPQPFLDTGEAVALTSAFIISFLLRFRLPRRKWNHFFPPVILLLHGGNSLPRIARLHSSRNNLPPLQSTPVVLPSVPPPPNLPATPSHSLPSSAHHRVLIISWIIVGGAHYCCLILISSTSFLLLEFQKFAKSQNIAKIKAYRKLQMFEKLVNSTLKGRILPIFAYAIPLLQIFVGFVTAKMITIQPLNPRVGLFAYGYVGAILMSVLTLTSAGMVNTLSKEWIKSGNGKERSTNIGRKMHASLAPLKIRFANNFVDKLTPLVMQEFCVSQSVTLLILTGF
ncbi:Alpha-D-ribose 1-methylphosphonate 5-triphosphate synthase subunit PhnL [Folsomia candida]|uniref:Alpha-D-ribose 1-methylphosphonate 5-triphosphate synthase subunit PhnL n=1 Tax=Folsomia candida TaxID=158441 RepID=A0A226DT99_FOLCA|nr:Alpha-D-ribose 1-methylphosphonate 5-triphosphate synthase subunit PhnL [Folsomia candida]